jgi:hypothetical protein
MKRRIVAELNTLQAELDAFKRLQAEESVSALHEAGFEPVGGEDGDFFQSAGLFEEVGRAVNGDEFFDAVESRQGLAVEVKDTFVAFADDQQGRAFDFQQRWAREVRTAAPGNDGLDEAWVLGRGFKGGSAAGAGSKKADLQSLGVRVGLHPCGGLGEAFGKELDIKAQVPGAVVDFLFFRAEEIKQKGAESGGTKDAGDELVARAEAAAAAAVRKQDDACRAFRHIDLPAESDLAELEVLGFMKIFGRYGRHYGDMRHMSEKQPRERCRNSAKLLSIADFRLPNAERPEEPAPQIANRQSAIRSCSAAGELGAGEEDDLAIGFGLGLDFEGFAGGFDCPAPLMQFDRAKGHAVPRAEMAGFHFDDEFAKLNAASRAAAKVKDGGVFVYGLGPARESPAEADKVFLGVGEIAAFHQAHGDLDGSAGFGAFLIEPAFPQPGGGQRGSIGIRSGQAVRQFVLSTCKDQSQKSGFFLPAIAVFERANEAWYAVAIRSRLLRRRNKFFVKANHVRTRFLPILAQLNAFQLALSTMNEPA